MNSVKILICSPLLCLVLSCTSVKKSAIAPPGEQSLPELPMSELDIPIKISSAAVFAKAESLVPQEFRSDGWPDFLHPSCDFRYKYRFMRTGLQITAVNNLIHIQFGGNYQISGGKCLCTAGFPVTPWVSGSCGFAPQPLRKVNMAIRTQLQFLPNYALRSTTSITQVQAVDKCTVSAFSSDITQLVMDSIRSSLASFSIAMDQSVNRLDFSKFLATVKDSSYRKIRIGKYGYFLLNPSGFRIGQLNQVKDSFMISVGISCRPQLTSDAVNRVPVPSVLPGLLQTENRNGIRLYLNLNYDYDFLTRILRDSLHNKVFEVKGRTIVIKDARIRGLENHRIEVQVDFAGSNHGSIYLHGTPVLDSATQTLNIPDVAYSMEGEDLALKVARSLFKSRIRKTIRGKSYLDIAALVNTNKVQMERLLNREWMPGVYSSGTLQAAKIVAIQATSQGIQLQVFISGEIQLEAGNL